MSTTLTTTAPAGDYWAGSSFPVNAWPTSGYCQPWGWYPYPAPVVTAPVVIYWPERTSSDERIAKLEAQVELLTKLLAGKKRA